jgi:CP family cyanate transporter-like MFS transporter
VVLLAALFVAALALRPQLVGAGPLLPDIQDDLGVSHAVVGLLGTIPVLCMGVFAPAAAPLAGRAGLRTVVLASIAIIAVFGLARAAAPGVVLMLVLTLPLGIGMALAGALLPVAVKERFPDRPAFANGVCTTGINGGAAVASLAAVPAADALGGWRAVLTLFSAAALIQCVAWAALSRRAWTERTEERSRLPVRRPVVWMIVSVFALQSVVYYGLTTWVAAAFQERGWSAASAGALVAVLGFSTVPGGLLIPWLADRLGSRRRWLVILACAAAIATFGLAAIPGAGFLWTAMAGGAIGATFPLCLAMCLDVAHEPAAAGAAAALMFLGGYLVAALAPFGLGAVRDGTGSFSASLWALFGTALLLVAACLPLTARRLRPA